MAKRITAHGEAAPAAHTRTVSDHTGSDTKPDKYILIKMQKAVPSSAQTTAIKRLPRVIHTHPNSYCSGTYPAPSKIQVPPLRFLQGNESLLNLLQSPRQPALKGRQPQQPSLQKVQPTASV